MERPLVICAHCSTLFRKVRSEIRRSKSGNHFCSKSCAATYNNKAHPKRVAKRSARCIGCKVFSALPRRRYCSDLCQSTYAPSSLDRSLARSNSGLNRINWIKVQSHYDSPNSVRKCCERFKITPKVWRQARSAGLLKTRNYKDAGEIAWEHRKTPAEAIFISDSSVTRRVARYRILKDCLIPYECQECGSGPKWRGTPMSLILDHKNGINNDHRLMNLRLLCANCNTQTPTLSGRNSRQAREALLQ